MKSLASIALAACLMATALCTGGCQTPAADAARDQQAGPGPILVTTVSAEPSSLTRTTTQPATVHAYFTAEISAQTTGYLAKLNVDIGRKVKGGEVLGVIDVPELSSRRQTKLAAINRLQADEKRAAAEVAVARANFESHQALVEQSKANIGEAEAYVAAGRTEFERVGDLVKQKAVADRLLDEATKKFEAAQAQREAAAAGVTSAQAQLALSRAKTSAAEADLEVARAMTDVARRELGELDELLKFAQLTAPFDGVVTERHVDPGDLVRSTHNGSNGNGQPLLVVAKLDQVRVRVAVPERDAPLASVGDLVEISLQALPGETLSGGISRVAGVLDEQTRTMLVEVDLPNPDGKLTPGMFGQATITLDEAGDNVMLPAGAVRYDEHGAAYVYLVNSDDTIRVAPIQTGIDDGQRIEVTSGLNDGQRVVGPLLHRLKDGQKVDVRS